MISELIDQIRGISVLAIPFDEISADRVERSFGPVASSTKSWLVPCTHIFNPSATSNQIANAEKHLGFSIPEEYKRFLMVSDGAKLFLAERKRPQGGKPHVRYQLFGCDELVRVNSHCLRTFLAAYANDPEFSNVSRVNYLAFCDASNDNYQAIALDPENDHFVFMLFNELQCRPFNEKDQSFYYTIANSFATWLRCLIKSRGWRGRGEESGSL